MSHMCKCLVSYTEEKFRVDLLTVCKMNLKLAKLKPNSYRL